MQSKKHWTDFCIFWYRDESVKQRDTELQQAGCWSQPRNGNKPALLTADINLGKEIWVQNSASFAHLPIYSIPFSNDWLFFCLFCYFCLEEAVTWASAVHQLQVTGDKSLASSISIYDCQDKMAVKSKNTTQDAVTRLEGKTDSREWCFKGEEKPSYNYLARTTLGCVLWPHQKKFLK